MTVQPLPDSDPDGAKLRTRFWLTLLRATRSIENRIRDELRLSAGTTLPRFDVLAALYRNPAGLTMSELSKSLMVSNGNVTGIIERLVQEEFVIRKKLIHDRRSNIVRLTDKGWTSFRELAAQHDAWTETIFEDLSNEEIETVMKVMKKIHMERKESTR